MKLSVAMIVYNGAKYLEEALASIYSQSREADEIVVWDDGSTDATPEILSGEGSRIRWIREETNQGAFLARRAVVEAVTHSRVAFLDSDDRFHRDALSAFEVIVGENEEVDLLFGKMRNFFDPPETGTKNSRPWQKAKTAGNLLVKRSVFLAASHRVKGTPRAEFVSWYQAVKELGFSELDFEAPILERRIHSANASRHPETKRELFVSLQRHLEAKRRGESS